MTHVPTTSRGRFIGATAAASAVAFGCPAILSAQNKEIVVGLDVPLSGPYAEQGKDQLRAYNMAIDEINKAGGIMGQKVKSSVGDDQTTAGVARDNAQRMIERDGAVMITGGHGRRGVRSLPAKGLAVHGDAHARRRDDESELPQAHLPAL